jgi:hypothetical protein
VDCVVVFCVGLVLRFFVLVWFLFLGHLSRQVHVNLTKVL